MIIAIKIISPLDHSDFARQSGWLCSLWKYQCEIFVCWGFCFWVFFYWSSSVLALLCSSSTLAVGQWLELFRVCKDFSFWNRASNWCWHIFKWTRWSWVILSDLNYSVILLILWTHQIWTELLFLWMVRVFWHLYTEENGLSPCHWCSGLWINMPVLGTVLCKAIKNIAVVSCQRHTDYLLLQKCLLSTLPLSSHRVVQTRKLLCSNHMLILSHFCFF